VPHWIVRLLSYATQRDRFAARIHWRSLLVSLSILFALPTVGHDVVGYGAKATCQSAIDAEIAQGSELIESPGLANPVMKDFFGTIEFERTYNGTPAKIIYLCQGTKASGGSIVAQLIYIDRASERAARSEFARQKQWLEARLGAPCWDPTRLSDPQRALLPVGEKPEDVLGPRTIWKVGPNIFTEISWHDLPNATPAKWQVLIHTHGPGDISKAAEPFLTLYRKSRCKRLGASSTSTPEK
jgi:hypothetical protein